MRKSLKVFLPSIPDDIIAIILSKLPAKSIFKFKCISRSWNSLISSKQFVKTHLETSTEKNPNFTDHIIIITTPDNMCVWVLLPTLKLFEGRRSTYILNHHPIPFDAAVLLIVGSCNGLCCAIIDEKEENKIILWNPCTLKFKKFNIFIEKWRSFSFYGLGFDVFNDDYKVLVVMSLTSDQQDSVVYLYSLKSNHGKRMDNPFKGFLVSNCGSGTFVNGKLHWLMRRENDLRFEIVCFDMLNEKYEGVLVKPPIYLESHYDPTIGVLSGCLSMTCSNLITGMTDIWVFKESRWVRMVCSSHFKSYGRRLNDIPKLVCITSEGEVVFVSGQFLYRYDPKIDKFPLKIDVPEFGQVNSCLQSLVSPFI